MLQFIPHVLFYLNLAMYVLSTDDRTSFTVLIIRCKKHLHIVLQGLSAKLVYLYFIPQLPRFSTKLAFVNESLGSMSAVVPFVLSLVLSPHYSQFLVILEELGKSCPRSLLKVLNTTPMNASLIRNVWKGLG